MNRRWGAGAGAAAPDTPVLPHSPLHTPLAARRQQRPPGFSAQRPSASRLPTARRRWCSGSVSRRSAASPRRPCRWAWRGAWREAVRGMLCRLTQWQHRPDRHAMLTSSAHKKHAGTHTRPKGCSTCLLGGQPVCVGARLVVVDHGRQGGRHVHHLKRQAQLVLVEACRQAGGHRGAAHTWCVSRGFKRPALLPAAAAQCLRVCDPLVRGENVISGASGRGELANLGGAACVLRAASSPCGRPATQQGGGGGSTPWEGAARNLPCPAAPSHPAARLPPRRRATLRCGRCATASPPRSTTARCGTRPRAQTPKTRRCCRRKAGEKQIKVVNV